MSEQPASDQHETSGDAHEKLTYEQARQALGEIVQKLEAGGISLEESIGLWERGERLANECQRLLDGAQARLDEAIERSDQASYDEEDLDA